VKADAGVFDKDARKDGEGAKLRMLARLPGARQLQEVARALPSPR